MHLLYLFHLLLFFFTAPPTTEIYTLSLHDALPISRSQLHRGRYACDARGIARIEEQQRRVYPPGDLRRQRPDDVGGRVGGDRKVILPAGLCVREDEPELVARVERRRVLTWLGPHVDVVARNRTVRARVPLKGQDASGGISGSCDRQEEGVQDRFPAATEEHPAPFGFVRTLLLLAVRAAGGRRTVVSMRYLG